MKHFIEVGDVLPTNTYGDVKVIKKEGKFFTVQFIDSGYKTKVLRANLVAGKIKDRSKPNPLQKGWEDVFIESKNNAGDSFVILKRNSRKCIVQFKDTGYTLECFNANVKAGKVKDPYKRSFLGEGFLGEPKNVHYKGQAKQLWSNMMKRCYNPKDVRGYYGRCFVDERWKCFANFLEDLPSLDNFEHWVNSSNTGVKYNLDKDIKIPGNKIYSKAACSFVTEFENKSAGGINRHK